MIVHVGSACCTDSVGHWKNVADNARARYRSRMSRSMVLAIGVGVTLALGSLGVSSELHAEKKTKQKKTKKTKPVRRLNRLLREAPRMTNILLGKTIDGLDKKAQGNAGNWNFTIDNVKMGVITDERADRMRIVAPIVTVEDLDRDALLNLLQANFDRALDAKYAVSGGLVWATFIHPLSPLTAGEFKNAAKQVAALHNTYGTSYSSMNVIFGGGAP